MNFNYKTKASLLQNKIENLKLYKYVLPNVINLKIEQYERYDEIIKQRDEAITKLLQYYVKESIILDSLCKAKSNYMDKTTQKKKVKKILNEIRRLQNEEYHAIKQLLDKRQQKEFNYIYKIFNEDIKSNKQNYYYKNIDKILQKSQANEKTNKK